MSLSITSANKQDKAAVATRRPKGFQPGVKHRPPAVDMKAARAAGRLKRNAERERVAKMLAGATDDAVMTFMDWCHLNGFSYDTGKRVKASGGGPNFINLTGYTEGVTVGENRRWQASRACE